MGSFTLILIIVIIILIAFLTLTILALYGRLSFLNKRTLYAKDLIEENIDKKIKLLTKLNASIKKTLRAKKDYLTNIDEVNSELISYQDKDRQLSTYDKTVDNLMSDYSKLANNKEIKKQVSALLELNEKNDAAKTYFNKYMMKLSQSINKFPINLFAKIIKIKIIPLYDTNEINKINEEL